ILLLIILIIKKIKYPLMGTERNNPKAKTIKQKIFLENKLYEIKGIALISQYDLSLQLMFLLQLTSSIITSLSFLDTLFYFCVLFGVVFLVDLFCSTNQRINLDYLISRNEFFVKILSLAHFILHGISLVYIIHYISFTEIQKSVNKNYSSFIILVSIILVSSVLFLNLLYSLLFLFKISSSTIFISDKYNSFVLKKWFIFLFSFGFSVLSIGFYILMLCSEDYYLLLPATLYYFFGILIPLAVVIKNKFCILNQETYLMFTVEKFMFLFNVVYLLIIKEILKCLFGTNLKYIFYN
ncbi:hypothetical protein TUBRATIS_13870, partial [Tubulinosema ratisbonensis]